MLITSMETCVQHTSFNLRLDLPTTPSVKGMFVSASGHIGNPQASSRLLHRLAQPNEVAGGADLSLCRENPARRSRPEPLTTRARLIWSKDQAFVCSTTPVQAGNPGGLPTN